MQDRPVTLGVLEMTADSWISDWQERFRSILKNLGYNDAFAFVMSRKGESFGEMFGSLRRAASCEDAKFLALRHLEEAFYIDAENKGKLRDAFMEGLVRSMRQYMPHGWNRGKKLRERRIDVETRWPTPSFVTASGWQFDDWKTLKELAWKQIELIRPVDEWCPSDLNDPIVQNIFSRVWPEPEH